MKAMKNKKTLWKWLGAVAIVVLLVCTCRVTIIPDEVPETIVNEKGEVVKVQKLTYAQQYCQDNWESRILPTVRERAVDIPQFLADVSADLNAAGESYGNRANETSAWSFCVKGKVHVLGLENEEKATKTVLLLDVAPYDGQPDCKIHYATVFSPKIKNAIRDSVGFLRLDDFANQVEFADLTTAVNNRVKEDILQATAAQDYVGKEISFYGCISLTEAVYDNYIVIPVEVEVVGG